MSSDTRDPAMLRGLEVAHQHGLLTVALTGGAADGPIATSAAVDHRLHVPSDDPLVVKEVHVTAYHVLWELVHVFFDQPDVCITCADQAVEVVVVELFGDALARVDTGAGIEEVSVALVDVAVGGRILVHAGEAIAVVG
jgi:D-sedoheptulose 7-phosphate isomerase